VGSGERATRHQPPPAAARRHLEADARQLWQLRQAMSASKSPADIHLDVAPTPKGQVATPPAPLPHHPLWRSLPEDGYSTNRLLHRLIDTQTFGAP